MPPHSHEPNPHPPSGLADLQVTGPGRAPRRLTAAELRDLPAIEQADCYIVSTGHGTSGPFRFRGPALSVVAAHCGIADFRSVRVAGGDGFATVLTASEIMETRLGRMAMLAVTREGRALTRAQGLVRLIVPTERHDALKQIKWVSRIDFRTTPRRQVPIRSYRQAP